MTSRHIDVRGRAVWLFEEGEGAPVVYLHGLADIHGASSEPLEFHQQLGNGFRFIAPAHPGCSQSEEDDNLQTVEDLVFHYLEVLDALELQQFHLVGSDLGGWVAAEIAVRHPERVERLALIGPAGLFVPGEPIADLFWESHPVDGVSLAGLRSLLFGDCDQEIARTLFPDGRGEIDQELLRYRMFRLASRIGFNPPYLHHRRLHERLHRYRGPALIIQGADDRLVPPSHGKTYAAELGNARLESISGAGHSPHLERSRDTANLLIEFLSENP